MKLNGVATLINPDLLPEIGSQSIIAPIVENKSSKSHALSQLVQGALKNYFSHLEGQDPVNLYQLVLAEMEIPLLKQVLEFTRGNQSKAAQILGISRGTLRKKISTYKIQERRDYL